MDGQAKGGQVMRRALGRGSARRFYYVSPLLLGALPAWDAALGAAAALGFDAVLTAPLGLPGPSGHLLHPGDPDRAHPVLEREGELAPVLEVLVKHARAHGMEFHLDLRLDAVAAGGAIALAHPGWFEDATLGLVPDPRLPMEESGLLRAQWSAAPAGELLAAWTWRLRGWAALGVAGVRCLAPAGVSAAVWREVAASVPSLRLLAWAPGLSPAAVTGLRGVGFAGAFDSLAWWDASAGWLAEEAERLGAIGPRVSTVESPFGARLGTRGGDAAMAERDAARHLRLAAMLGDGVLVPMGVEWGARRPMDPVRDRPDVWAALCADPPADRRAVARTALALVGADAAPLRPLTGPGAPIMAMLREGAPSRVVLANPDLHTARAFAPGALLAGVAGAWNGLQTLELPPGAVVEHLPEVSPGPVAPVLEGSDAARATAAAAEPRVAVEAVAPAVDGGRFAVKRLVGEPVPVTADLLCDGHEVLGAALLWRPADEDAWREVPMHALGNDRWEGVFVPERLGRHIYAVEAWYDEFGSFRDGLEKKYAAGVPVVLELEEGRLLLAAAGVRVGGAAAALARQLVSATDDERLVTLLATETGAVMAAADDRPHRARSAEMPLDAERRGAAFASWYEVFPRSQSGDARRHGTFRDVVAQLPRIRAMGFDVLYFPPIHPIGHANRKGPNNTLTPGPDDPGSPYAIGGAAGGHEAIHPELGTFEDFAALREAAAREGIELALDFAIQCSPDHPWLREHRGWFAWRPDGSLRYAENPPKKYQDIVNVDFHGAEAVPDLWLALRDVVRLWADAGVRLFRVDNPHTKPLPFWEWLIAEVRATHADAVFLAEAFTKPKMMYRLAKVGFSQSYTYFTWRNEKREIMDYMEELTTTAPREFFRPHFFVNTPDINPYFLQTSGRAGHLIRAGLAATLSGLWGVYQGFELCESTPLPGREEYLDSEKYQTRVWPDRRAGDIVDEITALNRIRRGNPALHSHLGIAFQPAADDHVLWYRRANADRTNVLLCAVSLDPYAVRDSVVEVPLWEFGLADDGLLDVEDLMRETQFTWRGKTQRLRLDPAALPFAIFRVRPGA